MVFAEIIFFSNYIQDIDVVLPFPPSVGQSIRLPIGLVRQTNGDELEQGLFKIIDIEWVFVTKSMISKGRFNKLRIYVERK